MLSVAFKPFMLSVIMLNVVMLRVKFTDCHIEALYAERHYAVCRLCCMSLMQNGTSKPFMLRAVMLNVVMLSVVAPSKMA
jgi:hypothetical protein